eukprot:scaffold7714_cov25-Tisochrysis_lutea.AAC.2
MDCRTFTQVFLSHQYSPPDLSYYKMLSTRALPPSVWSCVPAGRRRGPRCYSLTMAHNSRRLM